MLGQGIKTFYPRVAFIVGDDPSQHRICGLSEGMARHGCTFCNCNTLHGLVYDPIRDIPRDITLIREECVKAERITNKFMSMKKNGFKISPEDKLLMKKLKHKNIHPYINPFHAAPMGFNNNIFKGAPPDLLHVYCAGLMKSLVNWVMTIVSCIAQVIPNFRKGPSIFDSRISNFPYVHDMPHVYWKTFNGGLMQFGRKSRKEKALATGSLGGFRSTTFISLLIQIYFAIGCYFDVLPAECEYSGSKLGNVTDKVLTAIASLLDSYFQSKRKTWTQDQIDHFGKTNNELYVHLILVWDLKQTLLCAYRISKHLKAIITPPKMRKLHMILHFTLYITWFRSLNHMDTSTYESAHKFLTTLIWDMTSKRHITMIKEMTDALTRRNHQTLMQMVVNLSTKGMNYVSNLIPPQFPENVIFDRLCNISYYPYKVNNELTKLDFIFHKNYTFDWSHICTHSAIAGPQQFLSFLNKFNINYLCQYYYNFTWADREIHHRLIFIHGLSYLGTKECDIGKGTMYAIPKYNKHDECKDSVKPRHDFILINRGTNNPSTLACIVLMFQLDK